MAQETIFLSGRNFVSIQAEEQLQWTKSRLYNDLDTTFPGWWLGPTNAPVSSRREDE
jgi:hypothetical protein